eukprot:RCo035455
MNLDVIKQKCSRFKEIADIQAFFGTMVNKLMEFRAYLPEAVLVSGGTFSVVSEAPPETLRHPSPGRSSFCSHTPSDGKSRVVPLTPAPGATAGAVVTTCPLAGSSSTAAIVAQSSKEPLSPMS